MSWRIRRGAELSATPWRNGLGTTRDVVTELDADGALLWQVSIAELTRDAAFSFFPGCDRLFTPVEGASPPALAIDGADYRDCPTMVPVFFAGDVPTTVRVPAPGKAFNVVWNRAFGAFHVDALLFRIGERVEVGNNAAVLYCRSGSLALPGARLTAGDSAVGPGAGPLTAEQAGTGLLVRRR